MQSNYFPKIFFLKSVKKGNASFDFVDKKWNCQIGIEGCMLRMLGINGV